MTEARASTQRPLTQSGKWRKALSQLRLKITGPYIFLAVVVAFAATYITTRYIVGSLEERFQKSLQDAGRLAADTVVQTEQRHLATLRSAAFTEGMPEAIEARDALAVHRLVSLIALNNKTDSLDILAGDKTALLSMHRVPGGGAMDYDFDQSADYAAWPLVNTILNNTRDELGDKYSDLVRAPWGWTLYTAGPIKRGDQVIGVIMVGTCVETLARELDQNALARITLYTLDGLPLASTLTLEHADLQLSPDVARRVLESENRVAIVRDVQTGGRPYAEVLSTLTVRREQVMGILAAALPAERLSSASVPARNWLIALFSAATALIVLMGTWMSARIVRPIQTLVSASQKVASGDLAATVAVNSSDEIAELSIAFNMMTSDLRERQRERDLFGRAVSPEVRDALLAGKVGLGGETLCATVLFSDIVGFTAMSEKLEPQQVVTFLNEYLTAMEQIIREHGGTINKYIGDAIVAIFGAPVGHRDDAARAVRAALGMHAQLAALNARRQVRGEPPLAHGIGISTGSAVAGAIGSPERLEYTIIGDTVNVASRLEAMTRQLHCEILLTEDVWKALGETQVSLEDKGEIKLKGRQEAVRIFELKV